MQRLYDFLRRHPTWVDSFWAVVLLGISGASIWKLGEAQAHHGSRPAMVAVSVVMSVVVALRRRFPEPMLLLAAATGLVQLVLDVETTVANFAMLVIVCTVAAVGERWASRFALYAGLCAAPLAQIRWPQDRTSLLGHLAIVVFQTVPFVLAWVLGDSMRTRRAYFAQLEERAARLEKEREAQAKVAVAAERARIAREMHDIVAHNLSVMIALADGAGFMAERAPERSAGAMAEVSRTGRRGSAAVSVPEGTLNVLARSTTLTRGESADAWTVLQTPAVLLYAGESVFGIWKSKTPGDYLQTTNQTYVQIERWK